LANQFRLCAKRSEDSIRSLLLFAANRNEKTRQLGGNHLPAPPPLLRLPLPRRARALRRLLALAALAEKSPPESS
jgi:hypothetical protein